MWVQLYSEQWRTCGDGITAVVEKLPQRWAAVRPPGLFSINGVQRLVDEQAQGTHDESPWRSLEVEKIFYLKDPCSQQGPQPCTLLDKSHKRKKKKVELKQSVEMSIVKLKER